MAMAGVIAAKIAIRAKQKREEEKKERDKIWHRVVDQSDNTGLED